ncbi:hypothetical protein B4119_3682 [Parageobacillus caldoxylosilyticus]|uniref:Uncharacterized protein n=1 Tax=Saccharococcus caldoxylosilyticus TaxID=81408 RepID=A0A150LH68_9BACL|nr:hypothetical protein B4119_3682 [Parageobacillus caldoxylosilyticus]
MGWQNVSGKGGGETICAFYAQRYRQLRRPIREDFLNPFRAT